MTKIEDLFTKIYVINLPNRSDRRTEINDQLLRIGLTEGLACKSVKLFPAIRPDDRGEFESIGARGCFLSHLAVLQDAIVNRFDRIVIFEDDLNFSPSYFDTWRSVSEFLVQNDWSIFYGGYALISDLKPIAEGVSFLSPDSVVRTTHFIALQGPAINAAAGYFERMLLRPAGHPDGGPMHVDGAYSWFRRQHAQYETYASVPELGYQRSSRTDIHVLAWYDRNEVLKYTSAAIRRVVNLFRRRV